MLNITDKVTAEVTQQMYAVVRRAIGYSHGAAAVEDVVSDALVRIVENADKYDPARPFIAWATTCARNAARNYAKASANRGHVSHVTRGEDGESEPVLDAVSGLPGSSGSVNAPDGRHEAFRLENAEWLTGALATLSDDERTFIFAISNGATQTEAGALVGWSAATAHRRRKDIAARLAAL